MTDANYSRDTLSELAAQGELYCIIDTLAHPETSSFIAEMADEELPEEQRGWAAPVPDLDVSEFLSEDSVPYVIKPTPRMWRFIMNEIWLDDEEITPDWGFFLRIKDRSIPSTTLVKHWRQWYLVTLPVHVTPTEQTPENIGQAGTRAVFRFYDPRLTPAFMGACTPDELAAFFGPCADIILPTDAHAARPYTAPQAAATKELTFPLTLRKEHMKALERQQLEQRAPEFLAYLEKHFEPEITNWGIKDRKGFVKEGIRGAVRHNFLSERGVIAWLTLQLLFGPNFAVDQAWAKAILSGQSASTIGSDGLAETLVKTGFQQLAQKK